MGWLGKTQQAKGLLYRYATRKVVFNRIDDLIIGYTPFYNIITLPRLLPLPARDNKVKPLLIVCI